jgi:hypothetical protein
LYIFARWDHIGTLHQIVGSDRQLPSSSTIRCHSTHRDNELKRGSPFLSPLTKHDHPPEHHRCQRRLAPSTYVPVGIFVGGTSGIGQGYYTHGHAHIVLVGRNEAAACAILARIPALDESYTREFVHCDLSLVANAKRTYAQLAARFPLVLPFFLPPSFPCFSCS